MVAVSVSFANNFRVTLIGVLTVGLVMESLPGDAGVPPEG
jgi:hypothetical protein